MAGGAGVGRAAVRVSRTISAAPAHHRADLVVHVHLLVGDGAVRPGFARSWRLHGDRRLRDRVAVESLPPYSVAWHSSGDPCRHADRAVDRLSLLSLPHHWPLLRPGDAGP